MVKRLREGIDGLIHWLKVITVFSPRPSIINGHLVWISRLDLASFGMLSVIG